MDEDLRNRAAAAVLRDLELFEVRLRAEGGRLCLMLAVPDAYAADLIAAYAKADPATEVEDGKEVVHRGAAAAMVMRAQLVNAFLETAGDYEALARQIITLQQAERANGA